MSVFRIEKSKNYTVMSNYHLRDKNLSLKAKRLLSQMLSLPEDWDYTLRRLATINKESVEAIRTAVLELEQAGYISRRQTRDSRGRMSTSEYTIYKTLRISPLEPDKPVSQKPIRQKSTSENPTEINKDKQNKELLNTQSNPIRENLIAEIDAYKKLIKSNIDYDILCESHSKSKIDETVDLIAETVCTSRKRVHVAGGAHPADAVRSRLLKIDSSHIEYILEFLRGNNTQVHNIRQYTLTALFNAPTTMNRYYSAKVNHDLYGGIMKRYRRLTPDTYRSINAVIKQYYCNYYDGNCILFDSSYSCTCHQSISYSLLCKWFRDNVLLNDSKLYGELIITENRKRCSVCGRYFITNSNRAKYCDDCRKRIIHLKAAQRMRKQREMSRFRAI